MSYDHIVRLAQDYDFRMRIAACVASEGFTTPHPTTFADQIQWQVAATPDMVTNYAFAVDTEAYENPGKQEHIVTDAAILAAVQPLVQAKLAEQEKAKSEQEQRQVYELSMMQVNMPAEPEEEQSEQSSEVFFSPTEFESVEEEPIVVYGEDQEPVFPWVNKLPGDSVLDDSVEGEVVGAEEVKSEEVPDDFYEDPEIVYGTPEEDETETTELEFDTPEEAAVEVEEEIKSEELTQEELDDPEVVYEDVQDEPVELFVDEPEEALSDIEEARLEGQF